ncbi:MAG: hypothetical protein QHH02_03730 [Syntrophomonadaceae bacterium]|jgi:hypothetical protein|nr:hypothetical protein [Syntrophomonadaceae bacterium]
MPLKTLPEIKCDSCGMVIQDGEKVLYVNGIILHSRQECREGFGRGSWHWPSHSTVAGVEG